MKLSQRWRLFNFFLEPANSVPFAFSKITWCGKTFMPFARKAFAPLLVTLRMASSLLRMPPVLTAEPASPGLPARAKTAGVISGTKRNSRAFGFFFGLSSKRPSSSVKINSRSASRKSATSLESLSLSPTLISATASESFSLIIGTILRASIALMVFCKFL